MRAIVCGGRDYVNDNFLYAALDSVRGLTHVISGGAPGADYLAECWAEFRKVAFNEEPADWKRYGNSAGSKRNVRMLIKWSPDIVIAFKGGNGTRHMMTIAKHAEVPVIEMIEDEPAIGDLMTVSEFIQACDHDYLIDYDGHGCLATTHGVSNVEIHPSKAKDFVFPEWATHVMWYNR